MAEKKHTNEVPKSKQSSTAGKPMPPVNQKRADKIAEVVKQSYKDHAGSYRYLREK